MFNMRDLLGALTQSGLTGSTNQRMRNALSAGGRAPDGLLSGLFGGSSAGGGLGDALSKMLGGGSGGGIGGMLGNVLDDASRAVGGKRNLAVGGIGALVGALMGGGGRSMGGALGGGVMALLGAMGYAALKKGGQVTPEEVPVGLQEPETPEEKKAFEHDAGLVLKAMINATKADGKIDEQEMTRIIGKLGEMGIDSEAKAFVTAEMRKPMDTDGLVNAAAGQPALGAQLYAASLLAIEVDTPAEQAYMKNLAERLGLNPETVAVLEQAIGMQRT